jgi:hypothetical protein
MSKASEALRAAAIETREAAWKDGIDPDGPLGVWVRSQERALAAQALMLDEQETRVTNVVTTAKEAVDGQVEVLKKTLALAQEHNKRHEILARQSETDRERLVNHTVDQLTEQVSAKLSGALVLRQRRYDRTHRWGSAALVAGVMLALFLCGYSLHAYQWRYETGSVQRCLQSAVRSADGTLFCQVKAVQAAW